MWLASSLFSNMVQFIDPCVNAILLLAGDIPACDLPVCKYGSRCYRKNPCHFEQFQHPDEEGYSHTRASIDLDFELSDLYELLYDRYVLEDSVECTFACLGGVGSASTLSTDAELRDSVLKSCSAGETLIILVTFSNSASAASARPDSVIRTDSSVDALHALISRLAL